MPSLLQHAERLDVEALWATACEAVTSMINTVADNSVPSTRGRIPEFRQAPLFKDGKRKHARCNFTTALKLIHEIRNKAKVWHQSVSPEWTSQLFATIFNASKVAAKCGVSASFNASSPLELQASCTSLQEELIRKLEACETVRSQELIDQWKHKIKLSARGNRSRVHRWLKGERVGQPRFFRREDGSITSDPNEMLEMISEHMETIYNFHADKDVDQMEAEFYEKYHEAMDKIATDADIPAIHHVDLFKLFKKKSSCKASGLDGWKVAELQHLPPSGWIPFALVMKVAEATGVWPAALRLVSIASISKGVDMSSPKNIRCIGIASVIYSLWSSLRFRHLMQWQAAVFPPSLIGGISARSGDDSEWLLSMDLHNDHSDTMALFLDRFKCFDLVIPQVSLGIARRLGLPEHVYRAALGFYSNQTKFFKLGSAFGRRVLASNSAVQGCSMSIVMINSAYAVFATVLNNVCPSISFRSFIDDAKFWTPENNRGELANALSCVEQFDQSIGQVLNPEKTTLLTKRQAKADRFLREVGRQSFRRKKTVKSLGYTQSCRLKGSVSIQNERAAKACQMLRKIAVLPLTQQQKQIHIHSNAHSKWVYGSEIQAPSARALHSIRSAVVACLFKKNPVRCPFLSMATRADPFLDPFGKWALHSFCKLRKMIRKHPGLAVRVLVNAQGLAGKVQQTSNGVAAVFAFLCQELQWSILDAENFVVLTPQRGEICLAAGSSQHFKDELGVAVRTYLLQKVSCRHDCQLSSNIPDIDIFLTRFLADSDFRSDKDFEFLKPFLQRLPQIMPTLAPFWTCL